MIDWLASIDYWHWWMLAGLLIILELSTPKFIFLWLGIAAVAVGFLVTVFPGLSASLQLAVFGALGFIATIAWFRFRETG